MRHFLVVAALLAAVSPGLAQHQHHEAPPAAQESLLPAACRSSAPAETPTAHDGMAMNEMNEHQQAAMAGMVAMDRDMMAGMMQDDADMAFICGMIAHHQGAIAMSEVVLEFGDDAEARALAERIITAQRVEIAEMTAWVEKNAN